MYVSVLAERFNGRVKNKAAKRNMIADGFAWGISRTLGNVRCGY